MGWNRRQGNVEPFVARRKLLGHPVAMVYNVFGITGLSAGRHRSPHVFLLGTLGNISETCQRQLLLTTVITLLYKISYYFNEIISFTFLILYCSPLENFLLFQWNNFLYFYKSSLFPNLFSKSSYSFKCSSFIFSNLLHLLIFPDFFLKILFPSFHFHFFIWFFRIHFSQIYFFKSLFFQNKLYLQNVYCLEKFLIASVLSRTKVPQRILLSTTEMLLFSGLGWEISSV